MRRNVAHLLSILIVLACSPYSSVSGQGTHLDFPSTGGVATLYAHDAQLATLSLLDGRSGMVTQNHRLFNRDSHLAFHIYERNGLRAGIQGSQRGVIVDLGSGDDLQARYGYRETVGRSQGFASIHRDGGKLVISKDDGRTFQPLKEEAQLSSAEGDLTSAPVVPGHIYVVRIAQDDTEVVTAKLRVLAYTPGQFVTIRWERL